VEDKRITSEPLGANMRIGKTGFVAQVMGR